MRSAAALFQFLQCVTQAPVFVPMLALSRCHCWQRISYITCLTQNTQPLTPLRPRPLRAFAKHRAKWALTDMYRAPGPIQFYSAGARDTNMTLMYELMGDGADAAAALDPECGAAAKPVAMGSANMLFRPVTQAMRSKVEASRLEYEPKVRETCVDRHNSTERGKGLEIRSGGVCSAGRRIAARIRGEVARARVLRRRTRCVKSVVCWSSLLGVHSFGSSRVSGPHAHGTLTFKLRATATSMRMIFCSTTGAAVLGRPLRHQGVLH
jgi:hypothetical protein